MVKKQPESFDPDDLMNSGDILRASGTMYRGNAILSRTPKASKSYNWKEIVSRIYKQDKHGSELHVMILPLTINQLLDGWSYAQLPIELGTMVCEKG